MSARPSPGGRAVATDTHRRALNRRALNRRALNRRAANRRAANATETTEEAHR
jgi:hypothetical protein